MELPQDRQRPVPTSPVPAFCAPVSENATSSKKQKTMKSWDKKTETQVEIQTLSLDEALSAGLAFEHLNSYDGALASFQRAVGCDPTHVGALIHLTDVYLALKDPREALKCCIKASKLETGKIDAAVWFRLGVTHAVLGHQLEATKAYQKSINLNVVALERATEEADEEVAELRKDYGVTLAALAEAFGELGELDAAVKVFEDAVARLPDTANMHYNLANMRMARSGSTGDDAFDAVVAQSLEQAIKLSPETCDFVEELASYLKQHKQQPDRVCELLRKVDQLKFARTAAAAERVDALKQEKGAYSDGEEDVSEEEEDNEEAEEEYED